MGGLYDATTLCVLLRIRNVEDLARASQIKEDMVSGKCLHVELGNNPPASE